MYEVNGHDLLRMGYIPDFYRSTKKQLSKNDLKRKYYHSNSSDKVKKNDFLVIGDSFSEGENSFTNLISKKRSVTCYKDNEQNPLKRLTNLINRNYFDSIKVSYVVLENVERYVVDGAVNISANSFFQKNTITKSTSNKHVFFSNQSILFAYNTLKYLFFKNVLLNDNVYSFSLSKKMFNHFKGDEILLIKEDLDIVPFNNDLRNLKKLNTLINNFSKKLNEKGVKLIFFVCPDKYDLYYPFMKTKKTKPLFFESFSKLEKKYHYIDSKKLLTNCFKRNTHDLYFYDDTHWTINAYRLFSDTLLNFK